MKNWRLCALLALCVSRTSMLRFPQTVSDELYLCGDNRRERPGDHLGGQAPIPCLAGGLPTGIGGPSWNCEARNWSGDALAASLERTYRENNKRSCRGTHEIREIAFAALLSILGVQSKPRISCRHAPTRARPLERRSPTPLAAPTNPPRQPTAKWCSPRPLQPTTGLKPIGLWKTLCPQRPGSGRPMPAGYKSRKCRSPRAGCLCQT